MAQAVTRLLSLIVCILLLHSLSGDARRLPIQQPRKADAVRRSTLKRDNNPATPANVDVCGTLIAQYNNDGTTQFPARQAYDCLKRVPFNADIAKAFLAYYRDTLSLQSTLAYLQTPPTSYQQPGVDVLFAIDAIEDNIDNGLYVNEYAFEADVQRVTYRMHDTHVSVYAGILNVFTFGSPVDVVSISEDGVKLPKPYLKSDVIGNAGSFTPSPISTINGQDAVTYLKIYAKVNAYGYIEPHADWNAMMYTPTLDIEYYPTVFNSTVFYTGDLLDIQLENGTALPTMDFIANAYFSQDASSINNAQDFYNTFVTLPTGYYDYSDSSSTDADSATATSTSIAASPTASGDLLFPTNSASPNDDNDASSDLTDPATNNWNYFSSITAYPQPDIAQPNLGYGGWLTGYFLHDSATAVLSIPSFQLCTDTRASFSNSVADFLARAKDADMRRVVVDLQQNFGGELLLAVDAFKHFFPAEAVQTGSRMRAAELADTVGNTLTPDFQRYIDRPGTWAQEDVLALVDSPFAPLNYINAATGRYFGSWGEYFGPVADHGVGYTVTSQYNYSDPLFIASASGAASTNSDNDDSDTDTTAPLNTTTLNNLIPYGYNSTTNPSAPPFAPEDIVLLTDTACASTCALFANLMRGIPGVNSVVIGGLPQLGPAQLAGATRGAQSYTDAALNANIDLAAKVNDTAATLFPQNRDTLNFTVDQISLNLRDQVQPDVPGAPAQFVYAPADCRIFWTQRSLNNFTDLWTRAAAATWDDPAGLCVPDSTGQVRPEPDLLGPNATAKAAWSRGQTLAAYTAEAAANATKANAHLHEDGTYASLVLGGLGSELTDLGKGQPREPRTSCTPGYCNGRGGNCVQKVVCRRGECTVAKSVSCEQPCSNGRQGRQCGVSGGSCNARGAFCGANGGQCVLANARYFQGYCVDGRAKCGDEELAVARQAAEDDRRDKERLVVICN